MYEELIKQLRWMEDVCKKDISCPVPCINECFFKEAADAIEQLIKERDDWKTTAKLERDGMWEWFENYQKDVPHWIPVEEKLPDEYGHYLAYFVSGEFNQVAWIEIVYFWKGFAWEHKFGDEYREKITHWMPLPEPPSSNEL